MKILTCKCRVSPCFREIECNLKETLSKELTGWCWMEIVENMHWSGKRWQLILMNGERLLRLMYLAYTITSTSSTAGDFHCHQQVVQPGCTVPFFLILAVGLKGMKRPEGLLHLKHADVCLDCFCCMYWLQLPMLHGVNWQKYILKLNSSVCWNFHIQCKEGQNDVLPDQSCPVSLLHRHSTWSPSNARSCLLSYYKLHCLST